MGKVEKKKARVLEMIAHLENEMRESLQKKTHDTNEISLSGYQQKIKELKDKLNSL